MKAKALKFTKNHGFHRVSRKHGNGRFLRKKANFTENVTAVKSWIRLVPNSTVFCFSVHISLSHGGLLSGRSVILSVQLASEAVDYRVNLRTVVISFVASVVIFALIYVVCFRFDASIYSRTFDLACFSFQSFERLCVFGLHDAIYKNFFRLHPSLSLLVSWAWWDWPLTWLTNHRPSVLWHCWLGHVTRKIVSEMTYNVSSGTLNHTIPYHSRMSRTVINARASDNL